MQKMSRLAALILAGAVASAPAFAADKGKAFATVNGQAIPQAVYDAFAAEQKAQGATDSPELQNAIKEELVRREIIAQEAKKQGVDKKPEVQVTCPVCHEGHMLQRRSRRGKTFYSCSRYPACDYAVWNEPVATPCPNCNWPILTLKTTKKSGTELICPQKDCGHSEPYEEQPEQTRRAAQG